MKQTMKKSRRLPELSEKDIDRLWSKIKIAGTDDCWEYLRGRDKDGYGNFWAGGRPVRAHRVVHFLHSGEQPEEVCHRCDNPGCCNPHHLFSGSPKENAIDRSSKGRGRRPKGESHHLAKLTEQAVREIRSRYSKRTVTQAQLASEFGVAVSTICQVISGERWPHVA